MSKSVSDPRGTILLSDDPLAAVKKVMRAETDNLGRINWDWDNQPGITNLLQISSILGSESREQVISQWCGGERYGDLKKYVAELVENFLVDFQNKMSNYSNDYIIQLLESNEMNAKAIANQKLTEIQKAVGLRK